MPQVHATVFHPLHAPSIADQKHLFFVSTTTAGSDLVPACAISWPARRSSRMSNSAMCCPGHSSEYRCISMSIMSAPAGG
jgi:hypothetical protein